MARFRTTAQDAWRRLREQNFSLWTAPRIDPTDVEGSFAVQRLRKPYFKPFLTDTIPIDRGVRMFAIGSCFARGIESHLVDMGMDLASADPVFDTPEFNPDGIEGRGFINKYTTHAILADLRWALDPGAAFPVDSFVAVGDGTWIDPHFSHRIRPVDREHTEWRRSELTRVSGLVATADVVFITLGLVEAWFDRQTGHYLNWMPDPARLPTLDLSRYRFEVADFKQNWQNLEELHALLSRYGAPDLQIVVTVSPVPLSGTFTGRDVVEANTYSKSVLRACAAEWAGEHDNVHYFPSYEIVMNSDRGLAWTEDGRHVDPALVYQITQRFVKSFVDEGTSAGSRRARKAAYVRDRIRARAIGDFIARHGPPSPRLALDLRAGPGDSTRLLARLAGADRTIGYSAEEKPVARLDDFVLRRYEVDASPLPDGPGDVVLVTPELLAADDARARLAAWGEGLSTEGRLFIIYVTGAASDDDVFGRCLQLFEAVDPWLQLPEEPEISAKAAGLEVAAAERTIFELSAREASALFRRRLGGLSTRLVTDGLITRAELDDLIAAVEEHEERGPVLYSVVRVAAGRA